MKDWKDETGRRRSGLGKPVETLMNKTYAPSSRVEMKFGNKDLTFITNENGEPITLFIGKRKENGMIAGERYSRRIKQMQNGKIVDSHWDNQGKIR